MLTFPASDEPAVDIPTIPMATASASLISLPPDLCCWIAPIAVEEEGATERPRARWQIGTTRCRPFPPTRLFPRLRQCRDGRCGPRSCGALPFALLPSGL